VIYYNLLPDDGLVLQHMLDDLERLSALIRPLTEEQLTTRWAPGEWTIKEILAHIADDEWIIAYRALRFARNDQTLLPGFDQDLYTAHSGANGRRVEDILAELAHVRRATVALFDGLEEEAFDRWGIMAEHRTTVRARLSHRWPRRASHRDLSHPYAADTP
jgi:DinB superfamily